MILEREGAKPITKPTPKQIERGLLKLRTTGPSGYATLTAANGDYLQVAGSPGGCLLERREAASGTHYRAYQDTPVVPFEDGTELRFSGGTIALQRGEWFRLAQATEAFVCFAEGRALPEEICWREITELLDG